MSASPAPRERAHADDDLGPISATSALMVSRALEFASVSSADVVYDLGCNDGRVCVAAAVERGARAVGVEIDERACSIARENVTKGARDDDERGASSKTDARDARVETANVRDLVDIKHASAFDVSIADATLVFVYLLPKGNAKLSVKLLEELRPGARVVAYMFKMPSDAWDDKLVDSRGFASSRDRPSGGVDASVYNKLYLYQI